MKDERKRKRGEEKFQINFSNQIFCLAETAVGADIQRLVVVPIGQ